MTGEAATKFCFKEASVTLGLSEDDLESLGKLENALGSLSSVVEAGDASTFRQCLWPVDHRVSCIESVSLSAAAKVAFTSLAILRELSQVLGQDQWLHRASCASESGNIAQELQSELSDVLVKLIARCNRINSTREGLIPSVDLANNNGLIVKRRVQGVSSIATLHEMEYRPLDTPSRSSLHTIHGGESKRRSLLTHSMLCFTYSVVQQQPSLSPKEVGSGKNGVSTVSCLGKAVIDVVLDWVQEHSSTLSSGSGRTVTGRDMWKSLVQAASSHVVELFVTYKNSNSGGDDGLVVPEWVKTRSSLSRVDDPLHAHARSQVPWAREADHPCFCRDLTAIRTLFGVGGVSSSPMRLCAVRSLSKRLVKASKECCTQAQAQAQAQGERRKEGGRDLGGFRGLICHRLECLVPLLCLSVARDARGDSGSDRCSYEDEEEDDEKEREGEGRPRGKRRCLERGLTAISESLLMCEDALSAISDCGSGSGSGSGSEGETEEEVDTLHALRKMLLSAAGYVILYSLSTIGQSAPEGGHTFGPEQRSGRDRLVGLVRKVFAADSAYPYRQGVCLSEHEHRRRQDGAGSVAEDTAAGYPVGRSESDGGDTCGLETEPQQRVLRRLQCVHPSLSLALLLQVFPMLGLLVSPQAVDKLNAASGDDSSVIRGAFHAFDLHALVAPWLVPERSANRARTARRDRGGAGGSGTPLPAAGATAGAVGALLQLPLPERAVGVVRDFQRRYQSIRMTLGTADRDGQGPWWPQRQQRGIAPSLCVNPHSLTRPELRRFRERVQRVYQAAMTSTACPEEDGEDGERDGPAGSSSCSRAPARNATPAGTSVVQALHDSSDHGGSSAVLSHVLTFLTHKRVCRLACVSRTFRAVCTSSRLWLALFVLKYGREGVNVHCSEPGDERGRSRQLLTSLAPHASSHSPHPGLVCKVGTIDSLSAQPCSHCIALRETVASGRLHTFRRAPVTTSASTVCCPQLFLRHDWRALYMHRMAAHKKLRLSQAYQAYLKATRLAIAARKGSKRKDKQEDEHAKGSHKGARKEAHLFHPHVCQALGCGAILATKIQATQHDAEHRRRETTVKPKSKPKAMRAKAKAATKCREASD